MEARRTMQSTVKFGVGLKVEEILTAIVNETNK